jgi:protease-4
MFLFRAIGNFLRFVGNHFKAIFLIAFIIWLFSPSGEQLQPYNLAKVEIVGTILDNHEIIQELKEIYYDDTIEGVLLLIDSGGGSMSASVEIAELVKKIREKKKVVTYASGTLASGSYYSAIWSDKILVNRGSLVGSIGVIFDGVNYKELSEKIGVESQIAKAGKFKESGTGAREWHSYERDEIERVINDSYQMFISDVAEARELDLNRSSEWADAHIFVATDAIKLGLVDETATLIDAENSLEELTGTLNPVWEKEDELNQFMRTFSAKIAGEFLYLFDYKLR